MNDLQLKRLKTLHPNLMGKPFFTAAWSAISLCQIGTFVDEMSSMLICFS